MAHVPAKRGVNNRGDGTMFDRSQFHYDQANDTFRCPAGQTLIRKQQKKDKPCVGLHGCCGCLPSMRSKEPLHPIPATLCHRSPARGCAGSHASARHTASDAAQTIYSRASLRND